MTQQIEIAQRMLDKHAQAKRIFGAGYDKVIAPWKRAILAVAQSRNCRRMEAALFIVKHLEQRGGMDNFATLAMTAALVELVKGQPDAE